MLGPFISAALLTSTLGLSAASQSSFAGSNSDDQPRLVEGLAANEIRLGNGTLVHRTELSVRDVRQLAVAGSPALIVLWYETDGKQEFARYRLRLAPDKAFGRVRDAEPTLHLKRGNFDPLRDKLPVAPKGLAQSGKLYIVQYETQSIEAYRDALVARGAIVRHHMPAHANLVEMDGGTAAEVAELPFVRWVGPYQAFYRLEQELLDEIVSGNGPARQRVHIQVLERGPEMKGRVAARVEALGAEVVWTIEEGFRFDAMLSAQDMQTIAGWDEVLWLDRHSEMEEDMDKVRIDGGANMVEQVAGFDGTGVRGEILDGNILTTHPDLQTHPVIIHRAGSGSASHGTPCVGIVFGTGAGLAARRGMLPDGQPIFAGGGFVNRYQLTAELLQAPYNCVFQSNSTGSTRTFLYTSISMEMDDILFDHDIVILQSQSNAGNQDSRPQAWAKNILSVGGIRHQNTQTLGDDNWTNAGSIGPAEDGRIKPDMSYWYDSITAPSSTGGSTEFGGTSAATPMTAGHFGLFFEMWHNGVFGNTPTGATVFQSRPKATLARAFMMNTASRYAFSGVAADLTRVHQGWGRANVQTLYENRDKYFYINETDVLAETASVSYPITVDANTPELVVTLVYLDPAGTTSSSLHRINDLSLRVTAPGGATFYWGNNGLTAGNVSTSGGVSNTKDPIEMVIVPNPAAGTWTVEVFADDINQDSHVETPALDADFALVVRGTSGSGGTPCTNPTVYCTGAPNSWTPAGARFAAIGSTSVAANNIRFDVTGMTASSFGLLVQGDTQASVPAGYGTLCIGGSLLRLAIQPSDSFGFASFPLDLTAPIGPPAAIVPGSTWNFQCWFRDVQNGVQGFNFSDAVSISWCD